MSLNPALDTFQDELLETAALRIERQLTPLCVCPEHGGYDVQRVVERAAAIVRALKCDGEAGLS